MTEIDWSKPIEFVDGRPASYLGFRDGEHIVTPPGRPTADSGNFYLDNGTHRYGHCPSIRNVTSKFDPTKPVQTRDGRKARIICTDRDYLKPIVAIIDQRHGGGNTVVYRYADGRMGSLADSAADLVNIPQPTHVFYGINRDGVDRAPCGNALAAQSCGTTGRALKLTFVDGQPTAAEIV